MYFQVGRGGWAIVGGWSQSAIKRLSTHVQSDDDFVPTKQDLSHRARRGALNTRDLFN
jgi:hypothetical protein